MYSQMSVSENMLQRCPEWTCNEVLRLIKEYGQRPALWDSECDGYKNKYKKHQDWMELATIFNRNKLEVERKMKILNSQYRRERVKAAKLRKAGVPHRITWYAYKSFSFLNKNYKLKKSTNSIKEENIEDDPENPATTSSDMGYVDDDPDEHTSPLNMLSFENESFGICEQNKETENVMPPPSQNHSSIQQNYSGHYERDEWSIFGELIAHGLRKLPDERTRCIVKHKINTVLYEAELLIYK